MDSFFDDVDEELRQIFSIASSPVPAVPLFHPPSLPPTPNQTSANPVNNRKRKSPAIINPNENENKNENEDKKILHRNVERQRRQEMSNLYSSLRSLIPQEYLKGKRSVSDHMHEAVNYIKYMQAKMRALNDKRDALVKRLSKFSKTKTLGQSSTNQQDIVAVRPSSAGGAQIAVDASIADNYLPLSTMIQVLEDEGIYLISCMSTVVNNRSMYKMECEVNWESDRDLNEVQKKLSILLLLA